MKTAIEVGTTQSAVQSGLKAICAILDRGKDKPDQDTVRTALRVFCSLTRVSNTMIQNCSFFADGKARVKK